jgi:hypothetical protein
MSAQKNVEWLQHRTEQYRSTMNNMCEAIEYFEEVEKLGPFRGDKHRRWDHTYADICKQKHVFRTQKCCNKIA